MTEFDEPINPIEDIAGLEPDSGMTLANGGESNIDKILDEKFGKMGENFDNEKPNFEPGGAGFTNESLAEQLTSTEPPQEGMKWEALPVADDELIYKIDYRGYIVTVDENGIEKAIPSSNDAKLAEIVSELQTNGQFLKVESVEELGDAKVEKGSQQEIEKNEAGTRFGTMFVLNREDMTIRMYMVKEVMEKPEQVVARIEDDDGDDILQKQIVSFLASPPQPEPEVTEAAAVTAPAEAQLTEEINFWEINDAYDYEDDNTLLSLVQTQPVVTFTKEPVITISEQSVTFETPAASASEVDTLESPEVIAQTSVEYDSVIQDDQYDLADDVISQPLYFENYQASGISVTIAQPETAPVQDQPAEEPEAEPVPELAPAVNFQNYIRVEKFVVTENTIVRVAESPIREAYAEEENTAELETEEGTVQASEAISVSEGDVLEETLDNAETQVENFNGIEIHVIDNSEESFDTSIISERADVNDEPAEAVVTVKTTEEREEIENYQPSSVTVTINTQETAQPVQIEKNDAIPVIKKESEPIKVPELNAAPVVKVEAQPIRLEKVDTKPIAKPEVAAHKVEVKNVEAKKPEETKIVKEPAKETAVKPEPIKIERIEPKAVNEVKTKVVERPAVKAVDAPKMTGKAPEVKVQMKDEAPRVEAWPIQIVAQGAEFAKASPTRGESRIVINSDRGQQFRNSAAPVKVMASKFESFKPSARQDSVAKILDQNEKDNSYTPAQRTGISVATIAR